MNGIKIPVGTLVSIDVLSVHNDIDIWGPIDPAEFNPLRFSPEIKRNQVAFLSFGIGPRNCIGMKFALIELKLALVNLIQNYQLLPGVNFPQNIDLIEGKFKFYKVIAHFLVQPLNSENLVLVHEPAKH